MQERVNTSDLLKRVNGGLPHCDEGFEELQEKIRRGYILEDVCFLREMNWARTIMVS
ncbi:hypothetical protein HOD75_04655 [archaeon]|jgi:hypothetical protein|nr:hypothetical protein [archaeon]MBT4242155.1 hypothetical protein [archaeon]MBT4417843.1 hypothetical protein [archaeon]